MAKFIPNAKMSKKAQKALAKKQRVTWDVDPVTRRIESKKHYDRKRDSRERFGEPTGVFHYPHILAEYPVPEGDVPHRAIPYAGTFRQRLNQGLNAANAEKAPTVAVDQQPGHVMEEQHGPQEPVL